MPGGVALGVPPPVLDAPAPDGAEAAPGPEAAPEVLDMIKVLDRD